MVRYKNYWVYTEALNLIVRSFFSLKTSLIPPISDSQGLAIEVSKLHEFEFLDSESNSADSDNIPEHIFAPARIFEHLEWISEIIKKRELSMVILLDSY